MAAHSTRYVSLHIMIPRDMKTQLDDAAAREGLPLSLYMRRWLRNRLTPIHKGVSHDHSEK
jgi:hypothetical protein